jgi:LacI family transcriptional regulator
MSMGALAAFEECNVRCPEDIALATFDDLTLDHSAHSRLTTVVQPSYEMGARAAALLMDRIDGKITGEPMIIRVVPTLVIRESTESPLRRLS